MNEQFKQILTAYDIYKEFKLGSVTLPVLRGVSLEVQKGEIVAIQGPSGSGKSTLLGILGGVRLSYQRLCLYRGSKY